MTRDDLKRILSERLKISLREADQLVVAILDSVVRSLRAGRKVTIRTFGTFGTRERRPRIGRNPKTGAPVEVPTRRIAYFRPSEILTALVNSNSEAPSAPPDESRGDGR